MAEKKRDSPPKPKVLFFSYRVSNLIPYAFSDPCPQESYPLFSLSNHYHQLGLGFGSGSGLFASPAKPLSSSLQAVEVLCSEVIAELLQAILYTLISC